MNNSKIDSHWILIRGLARESRHWGSFPSNLQAALNRHGQLHGPIARVDALDLPGTGRFSEMTSPSSISGIADFARTKFLELREAQRRSGEKPATKSYIVAMSLGGMVAARWMERWRDDFKGCVLINTSFRGYSPLFKRLTAPALLSLFKISRGSDALERERRILQLISNRPDLYEGAAKAWARFALERPVSLENFARQLLAAARFHCALEVPPVPVLILSSLGDRMVDPSCSEVIAKRWNAQIRQHATAGHDLTLDDDRWVIEQIMQFYERIGESK